MRASYKRRKQYTVGEYNLPEFDDNVDLIGKPREPAYYLPKSSPLDRTVKCRHCAATFRPEGAHIYRPKHERDFHGQQGQSGNTGP